MERAERAGRHEAPPWEAAVSLGGHSLSDPNILCCSGEQNLSSHCDTGPRASFCLASFLLCLGSKGLALFLILEFPSEPGRYYT